ncbi:hypothetical protein CFP56_036738 [Quercus suber]|uniref:Uncharacterized protein n=1 Tax=Quercus suber TaxID=58331 RepID=A0AAW0M9Y3_QUESU
MVEGVNVLQQSWHKVPTCNFLLRTYGTANRSASGIRYYSKLSMKPNLGFLVFTQLSHIPPLHIDRVPLLRPGCREENQLIISAGTQLPTI